LKDIKKTYAFFSFFLKEIFLKDKCYNINFVFFTGIYNAKVNSFFLSGFVNFFFKFFFLSFLTYNLYFKKFLKVLLFFFFGYFNKSMVKFVYFFLLLLLNNRYFMDFFFLQRVFLQIMYSRFLYKYYKKSFFVIHKIFLKRKIDKISSLGMFYFFKLVFFFPIAMNRRWQINFIRLRTFSSLKNVISELKKKFTKWVFYGFSREVEFINFIMSSNGLLIFCGNFSYFGSVFYNFWWSFWRKEVFSSKEKKYFKIKKRKNFKSRFFKSRWNFYLKKFKFFFVNTINKKKYLGLLKNYLFLQIYNIKILFYLYLYFFIKIYDFFFFRYIYYFFIFWFSFLQVFLLKKKSLVFCLMKDFFFWERTKSLMKDFLIFWTRFQIKFVFFADIFGWIYGDRDFFRVINFCGFIPFFRSFFFRKNGFWLLMKNISKNKRLMIFSIFTKAELWRLKKIVFNKALTMDELYLFQEIKLMIDGVFKKYRRILGLGQGQIRIITPKLVVAFEEGVHQTIEYMMKKFKNYVTKRIIVPRNGFKKAKKVIRVMIEERFKLLKNEQLPYKI
jgi:hypothetical protein